ncbi:hypothetical protein ACFP3U_00350 [Kitasatospora misakiensis]|uniref:PE-PGRS family protein n=1 Tax=Kitasatospora misakiensis TaxID=67330 RepID=A0ABW0WWY5_9ACTN
MTTATLTDPATARELLFGAEPGSAVDALAEALHEQGTVGALLHGVPRLTGAAGRAVEHEVAAALDGLLGRDLFGFAAAGWSRYAALTGAARRTRAAPESEEVVVLANHRITSANTPSVDLLVDGTPVGSVRMQLTLAIELAGVVAVIRRARLVELRAGTCTVTGTLLVQSQNLVQRRRRYDLPGAVRLRHGIPLLLDEPPEPVTPAATDAGTGAATVAEAPAEAATERLPRTGRRVA